MAPITKKRHILQSFNNLNNNQFTQNSGETDDSYSPKSPVIVSSLSVSLPVIQPPLQSKLDETSYKQIHAGTNNGYNDHNEHHHHQEMLQSENSKNSITQQQHYQQQFQQQQQLSPQYARVNRVVLDKNSDEYRKRRERNNIAVKKSRTKSKLKNAETMKKVNELKQENEVLRSKVTCLATELQLLKNVLAAHASSAHGAHLSEFDIKLLTSTEALSLSSPRTTNRSPSPPLVPIFGTSKHHNSHLTSTSYDPLQASLVPSSSFRDSLIRESIIHRNRINSSPSSASTSSSSSASMSPIMSPASPPITQSILESFYMSNIGSIHHSNSNSLNSSSVNGGLIFGQNRRLSPVTSLNSYNSRSSLNDSEDDY